MSSALQHPEVAHSQTPRLESCLGDPGGLVGSWYLAMRKGCRTSKLGCPSHLSRLPISGGRVQLHLGPLAWAGLKTLAAMLLSMRSQCSIRGRGTSTCTRVRRNDIDKPAGFCNNPLNNPKAYVPRAREVLDSTKSKK